MFICAPSVATNSFKALQESLRHLCRENLADPVGVGVVDDVFVVRGEVGVRVAGGRAAAAGFAVAQEIAVFARFDAAHHDRDDAGDAFAVGIGDPEPPAPAHADAQ